MGTIFLSLVIAYLIGSIPFAFLISKAKGINILKVGSHNPGAGNCYLSPGRLLDKYPDSARVQER